MRTDLAVKILNFTVTITSEQTSLMPSLARCVGTPWINEDHHHLTAETPLVVGAVDAIVFNALKQEIIHAPEKVGRFLAASSIRRQIKDDILVLIPSRDLIYIHNPNSRKVMVLGISDAVVAFNTSLIACLYIKAALEKAGWLAVHSSCVLQENRGYLILGHKGSGKTATALMFAHLGGYSLVSNDLCFIRATRESIEVISCPQPVSIGLGLLKALGWADRISYALRSGTLPHPRQHPEVTEMLRQGRCERLVGSEGEEMKCELFSQDLVEYFGIHLRSHGKINSLILPKIGLENSPKRGNLGATGKELGQHYLSNSERGFLFLPSPNAQTVDRSIKTTTDALLSLPHVRINLGSDLTQNFDLLNAAVTGVS